MSAAYSVLYDPALLSNPLPHLRGDHTYTQVKLKSIYLYYICTLVLQFVLVLPSHGRKLVGCQ